MENPLVARISAKGQERYWQCRRECVAAVDALADLIVFDLYSKGRQNHLLCPSVPFSHSYQEVSALASRSWSWILAVLSHWPLSMFQVQLLRQNSNDLETTLCSSDHIAFSEFELSTSTNSKNWSHSFLLPAASNDNTYSLQQVHIS